MPIISQWQKPLYVLLLTGPEKMAIIIQKGDGYEKKYGDCGSADPVDRGFGYRRFTPYEDLDGNAGAYFGNSRSRIPAYLGNRFLSLVRSLQDFDAREKTKNLIPPFSFIRLGQELQTCCRSLTIRFTLTTALYKYYDIR
jgi:hypothetical protein